MPRDQYFYQSSVLPEVLRPLTWFASCEFLTDVSRPQTPSTVYFATFPMSTLWFIGGDGSNRRASKLASWYSVVAKWIVNYLIVHAERVFGTELG